MTEKTRPIDIDCPNVWCDSKAGDPCSRGGRVVWYCQSRRRQAELQSSEQKTEAK